MDEFNDSWELQHLGIAIYITANIDAKRVERSVQITVDRAGPTEAVRVRIVESGGLEAEPPAVVQAFSKWIAEALTKLPFESLKAGLPAAEDRWHINAMAEFIENANDNVHDLAGGTAEYTTGDVLGMPSGSAEVIGDLTQHSGLPQDSVVEEFVGSLRLVSIALEILSGGLPVTSLTELLLDSVQKELARGFCDALTPRSRRPKAAVDVPSHRRIEVQWVGSLPHDVLPEPDEDIPSIIVGQKVEVTILETEKPPTIIAGSPIETPLPEAGRDKGRTM